MTRATLVLLLAALVLLAALAINLYDLASPSTGLTDAFPRPAAASDPSELSPVLTSVVVGGSGNQSGGAEEVIPVAPSVPSADLPSSATLDLASFALATPRVSFVVRSGIASTYGPAYSEWWVALPDGPGWRFRVCGPGGCRTLVSTDAGPSKAMQRAPYFRVVDLPVGSFEAVCAVPWTFGLCQVEVAILGRVR